MTFKDFQSLFILTDRFIIFELSLMHGSFHYICETLVAQRSLIDMLLCLKQRPECVFVLSICILTVCQTEI